MAGGDQGRGQTSTTGETAAPPASSRISRAARRRAIGAIATSAPRSKRYDASVRISNVRAVRRTDAGWNQALSSRMSVVVSATSLVAPPITPAIPTG